MMILWWVIIIAVVVAAVKWLSQQKRQSSEKDSAIEVLRKRYALGEISKQEFEEIKKNLR